MSIFKRKKDGKFIVQLWDKTRGKRVHVGVYDTRREAMEADLAAQGPRVSKNATVGQFATRWTLDYPRPAASTNQHNARMVQAFTDAHHDLPLTSITMETARAWCLQHRSHLSALRAMFSDARRSGYVTTNPFTDLGLDQSRGRKDLPSEWLTADDIDHLVRTATQIYHGPKGILVGAIIQFAAYSALRPGEVWALTHDCPNGDELEVRNAVRSSTGETAKPKNGRSRVVTLLPQAREAIERTPRLHDKLIFTSPTGRPLRNSAWHNLWDPVRNVAGFPAMQFYETRHYCATYLLELGLSPADVAVQCGHRDGGALVMSTYGHPSERAARNRILNAASIDHDGQNGKVRLIADN